MLKKLIGILCGVFLAALDTDAFQIDQNPFYRWLPFKATIIVNISRYMLEGAIFLLGAYSFRVFIRNRLALFLLTVFSVCYLTATFNIFHTGGTKTAVLGVELRQLWMLLLAAIVFVRFFDTPYVNAAVKAFAVINALKCVILIGNYFFGTRISVLGVQTMVWDFNFLFTQIAIVLMAVAVMLGRRATSLTWMTAASCSFLSVIVILGSFRRLAAVETALGVGLTFLIYGRQTGRLFRYVGLGSLTLVMAAAVAGGAYVQLFGATETMTRVHSLVSWQDRSSYSQSNQMYADDWRVATELIRRHPVLGIGFGKDYPIDRLTDEVRGETEDYIPLHVGLADFWVRMGMPFAFLHLLLIGVVLWRGIIRPTRSGEYLYAGAAAMCLILLTLPFAPAFIFDAKLTILFGFCFAYILRKEATEPENGNYYGYRG
jgi:hypothetical protein